MQQVKLVIWDLDGTFWDGTLSEEGIAVRPENQQLVRSLNRRGIMNSICSKNDFEIARRTLNEQGMWDEFVFSKVGWRPKGEMIAQIIDQMNLRAVNVLFVDDNPQNLEEAKFYNAGIQTAGPEIFDGLLERPEFQGKPDEQLTRWRQYRALELKVDDQDRFGTSNNEEFLRQCDIRVTIERNCADQFDRLLEMIERTNQLNFTKHRLNADSLRQILAEPALECGYVRVEDRYGDYGISGFYALGGGRLEHFLFSCRILNMGVEAWLYDRLGRPALDIVGEVSGDPRQLPVPDWIALENAQQATCPPQRVKQATKWPRVFFKGGCDLQQIIDLLGRPDRIQGEFNYMSAAGAPIHREHSENLRRCESDTLAKYGDVIDRIPFLDRAAFATAMFDEDNEVIVYSTLMDMTHGLYRMRGTDFVVAYGDFLCDMTRPENWARFSSRWPCLSTEFLRWFAEAFEFLGGLDEESFRRNLRWLCERVAPRQLILLNAAEIDFANPRETDRFRHHAKMNAVLSEVVGQYPHVDVCDVRLAARTRADVVDNIRHYRRSVYFQLAGQIERLIAGRHRLRTSALRAWWVAGKAIATRTVLSLLWRAKRRVLGSRRTPWLSSKVNSNRTSIRAAIGRAQRDP